MSLADKSSIAYYLFLNSIGIEYLYDQVIVVGLDRKKQIERVISRDGSSEELAKKIIENQFSLEKKMEKADIIIMNDGTLEELEDKVKKVYINLKRGN